MLFTPWLCHNSLQHLVCLIKATFTKYNSIMLNHFYTYHSKAYIALIVGFYFIP